MPDNLLLIVFGILTTMGIAFGGLSLYFAIQQAKKKDGEIKMALWSFGALAGLVLAGMSMAYFIIPILLHHLFH